MLCLEAACKMLNLHLFPADTGVAAFFCPADLFRKSALSQLKLARWVGTSKKGGVTVCTAQSSAKRLRPGGIHSTVPGWSANSGHKPWVYPGLGHQNFSYGKVWGFFGGVRVRGWNPTLMSTGDISMQGRHYLCALPTGAAPWGGIQPG